MFLNPKKSKMDFTIFSRIRRQSSCLQMGKNMKNDPKHSEKHQTLTMFNYEF